MAKLQILVLGLFGLCNWTLGYNVGVGIADITGPAAEIGMVIISLIKFKKCH